MSDLSKYCAPTPSHPDVPRFGDQYLLEHSAYRAYLSAYIAINSFSDGSVADCIRPHHAFIPLLEDAKHSNAITYWFRLPNGRKVDLVIYGDNSAFLLQDMGDGQARLHLHVFDFARSVRDSYTKLKYNIRLRRPERQHKRSSDGHHLEMAQANLCSEIGAESDDDNGSMWLDDAIPSRTNMRRCHPVARRVYKQLETEVLWYVENLPVSSPQTPALSLAFNKISDAKRDYITALVDAAYIAAFSQLTPENRAALEDVDLHLMAPRVHDNQIHGFTVKTAGVTWGSTLNLKSFAAQIEEALERDPQIVVGDCIAQEITLGSFDAIELHKFRKPSEVSAHDTIAAITRLSTAHADEES